jgi:hypothetical protein
MSNDDVCCCCCYRRRCLISQMSGSCVAWQSKLLPFCKQVFFYPPCIPTPKITTQTPLSHSQQAFSLRPWKLHLQSSAGTLILR